MEKLTKRLIDAAGPPERRPDEPGDSYRRRFAWVGDTQVPGFGLKIYGNGAKVFALRYRNPQGRSRTMKLGTFGEITVQDARALAQERKTEILKGEDPIAERQRKARETRTVGELLTRWTDEYAKAHRKRWTEDQRRVDARIRPTFGKMHPAELDAQRLSSWHRKMGKDSPVEANRCLETFRAVWRWAEAKEALPEGSKDSRIFRGGKNSPVKRFREQSRERWLRRHELARVLDETRQHEDPHVRAAIPLLLLTGLRKRELLSARWSDVDLGRGKIQLPETKSGKPQERELPSEAVRILRDLPRLDESPFVFPSPTDPAKHRRDLKRQWDAIRQAADLEDVTLHDLRRTAGSYMAQAGVPLQVIGKVLGHNRSAVTEVYARLASENERNALETFASEIGGLLNPDEDRTGEPSTLAARMRDAVGKDAEDPAAMARALRELAAELEAGR